MIVNAILGDGPTHPRGPKGPKWAQRCKKEHFCTFGRQSAKHRSFCTFVAKSAKMSSFSLFGFRNAKKGAANHLFHKHFGPGRKMNPKCVFGPKSTFWGPKCVFGPKSAFWAPERSPAKRGQGVYTLFCSAIGKSDVSAM